MRTVRRRFVCRPFSTSRHQTHALPASQHQTGSVLLTVRLRHSSDDSPAVKYGPPFTASLHHTHAPFAHQMYWTIGAKCNCRQHRRTNKNVSKVWDQRYLDVVKTEGILVHHHVKPRMRSRSMNGVAAVARSRFDGSLMFAQTVLCCL